MKKYTESDRRLKKFQKKYHNLVNKTNLLRTLKEDSRKNILNMFANKKLEAMFCDYYYTYRYKTMFFLLLGTTIFTLFLYNDLNSSEYLVWYFKYFTIFLRILPLPFDILFYASCCLCICKLKVNYIQFDLMTASLIILHITIGVLAQNFKSRIRMYPLGYLALTLGCAVLGSRVWIYYFMFIIPIVVYVVSYMLLAETGDLISWTLTMFVDSAKTSIFVFVYENSCRSTFIRNFRLKVFQMNIDHQKEKKELILRNAVPYFFIENIEKYPLKRTMLLRRELRVIMTDLVEFTKFCSNIDQLSLVFILNVMYTSFDRICEVWGLTKVKNIGDAYFAIDFHERGTMDTISFALDIQNRVKKGFRLSEEEDHLLLDDDDHHHHDDNITVEKVETGEEGSQSSENEYKKNKNLLYFQMRVGISKGKCIVGLIGMRRITFDCFGEAVDKAQKMEQTCIPGKTQICEKVASFFFDRSGDSSSSNGKIQKRYLDRYVIEKNDQTGGFFISEKDSFDEERSSEDESCEDENCDTPDCELAIEEEEPLSTSEMESYEEEDNVNAEYEKNRIKNDREDNGECGISSTELLEYVKSDDNNNYNSHSLGMYHESERDSNNSSESNEEEYVLEWSSDRGRGLIFENSSFQAKPHLERKNGHRNLMLLSEKMTGKRRKSVVHKDHFSSKAKKDWENKISKTSDQVENRSLKYFDSYNKCFWMTSWCCCCFYVGVWENLAFWEWKGYVHISTIHTLNIIATVIYFSLLLCVFLIHMSRPNEDIQTLSELCIEPGIIVNYVVLCVQIVITISMIFISFNYKNRNSNNYNQSNSFKKILRRYICSCCCCCCSLCNFCFFPLVSVLTFISGIILPITSWMSYLLFIRMTKGEVFNYIYEDTHLENMLCLWGTFLIFCFVNIPFQIRAFFATVTVIVFFTIMIYFYSYLPEFINLAIMYGLTDLGLQFFFFLQIELQEMKNFRFKNLIHVKNKQLRNETNEKLRILGYFFPQFVIRKMERLTTPIKVAAKSSRFSPTEDLNSLDLLQDETNTNSSRRINSEEIVMAENPGKSYEERESESLIGKKRKKKKNVSQTKMQEDELDQKLENLTSSDLLARRLFEKIDPGTVVFVKVYNLFNFSKNNDLGEKDGMNMNIKDVMKKMTFLNDLFSCFDELLSYYDTNVKIKSITTSYIFFTTNQNLGHFKTSRPTLEDCTTRDKNNMMNDGSESKNDTSIRGLRIGECLGKKRHRKIEVEDKKLLYKHEACSIALDMIRIFNQFAKSYGFCKLKDETEETEEEEEEEGEETEEEEEVVEEEEEEILLSSISVKIGIASGGFFAGMVGNSHLGAGVYDIFGSIVNKASRMCTLSEKNLIQCWGDFVEEKESLLSRKYFRFEKRLDPLYVKGFKEPVPSYYLMEKYNSTTKLSLE